MTFRITTSDNRMEFIHDVITCTRIGTHTYEFLQAGNRKMRAVDVIRIACDVECLCHNR